jgi:hypothetical protein
MTRRSDITLAQIADMSGSELSKEWARRYGAPAPNISADLLRMGLAYKFQEQRQGLMGRSTRTLLARASADRNTPAAAVVRALKPTPGTRLVRDWHGVGHTVILLDKGFEYGTQVGLAGTSLRSGNSDALVFCICSRAAARAMMQPEAWCWKADG